MANRELKYKLTLNTELFNKNAAAAFEKLKRRFQIPWNSTFNANKFGDAKKLKKGLAVSTSALAKGLRNSKGIDEAGRAFSRAGTIATRALTKFLGPYGKIAVVSAAVIPALMKLCQQFAAVENSTTKLTLARYRRAGAMTNDESDRVFRRAGIKGAALAVSGNVDLSAYQDALAQARAVGQSIDAGSFDAMAQNAAAFGTLTGRSPEELIQDLAPILDSVSVSFEGLRNIGADLTQEEINRVNALKSSGRQAEANAIILKRLERASAGLGSIFDDSLSDSIKRFMNIWKNAAVNVGRILSGPLKLFMLTINAVSMAIGSLAEIIGRIFEKLWSILNFMSSKPRYNGKNRGDTRYIDPRLQISAQFENMDSMTKRIQTAIVSKNSPGERQVGLLTSILKEVEALRENSSKHEKISLRQEKSMCDLNKSVAGLEFGLQ